MPEHQNIEYKASWDADIKIKNMLGITAEVNLLQEDVLDIIEIVVLPYSVPISLRGRYYYRRGSVKQECFSEVFPKIPQFFSLISII